MAKSSSIKKIKRYLKSYPLLLTLGIVLALWMRISWLSPLKVPSDSMFPNIVAGDFVFVEKKFFTFQNIHRGQLIVYQDSQHNEVQYLRRIVGKPGERVELKEGALHVNGQQMIHEDLWEQGEEGNYPIYRAKDLPPLNWGPLTVPEGQYLVAADRRIGANDSQLPRLIPQEQIIGAVRWVWMSIDENKSIRWSRIFRKVQ